MSESSMRVRPAAVAGMFYPADAEALRAEVRSYLDAAAVAETRVPKAVVVPHAGYRYSAEVAAKAYARLAAAKGWVRRVILIGPTHRVAVAGFALSNAETFDTPLGPVKVDAAATERLARRPDATPMDLAHAQEHALEVQLPFLVETLGPEIEIVPILAGQVSAEAVASLLEDEWGGPETLIVVSSDLSHYLSYDDCITLDTVTQHAIETLAPEKIDRPQACGRLPIAGLLLCAKRRGMTVETLDVRNSGDTAGPRGQVVGYGAWAFYDDPEVHSAVESYGADILALARDSIRYGLDNGAALPIDYESLPMELADLGASFVTIYTRGHMRGCIGSSRAIRSLAEDVAANAYAAAFNDPRFPALDPEEFDGLQITVSVLSPLEPMTFKDERDLVNQLEIGEDGLVISDHGHRALFLPQVWGQLPDPVVFLGQLKIKAGLPMSESPTLKAWRFRVESVGRDAR